MSLFLVNNEYEEMVVEFGWGFLVELDRRVVKEC